MLKIRLRRVGSRKNPFYRLIVSEKTMQPKGRFVEILGCYDPREKESSLKVKWERIDHWIGKGARPSESVRRILDRGRKAGATPAS
ncbi:MAG: 30S ribosomal protein S16 [Acidobacteriota bacterium]